jgi:hypothetical protein
LCPPPRLSNAGVCGGPRLGSCGEENRWPTRFLAQAGVSPQEEAFFLAARRAAARLCDVAPDMVHPDDSWRSLMDLQWDSGFFEDIVFELERELDTTLPFAYPTDDRLSFVAYVRQLAVCLGRSTTLRGESGAAAESSTRDA